MTPILSYIQEGKLPKDPNEARRTKVRSAWFAILNGQLYKQGYALPYLKCLNPQEANYALREIHEGICGNHSGPGSLVNKVVKAGYFWPTMQKDAYPLVQKWDKCQHFRNIQRIPTENIMSIASSWPFTTWGIDIIKPLPQGKKQTRFLLVAIDYFTKWVKEKPLARITEAKIQGFV